MFITKKSNWLLLLAALIFSNALWATTLPDNAIPVRCFGYAKPGTYQTMNCQPIAERHGYFKSVPAGYFLHVTDIIVTPDAGKNLYGLVDVAIQDIGEGALWERARLRNNVYSTFGKSYASAHLLVQPSHSLRASAAGFTSYWSHINVTGYLIPVSDVPTLH